MKKIKVALIHNIMAPYRFPLFNALAKIPEIDLTVLFMSTSAANRRWDIESYLNKIEFKYEVLPHFHIRLPVKDYTTYIINWSITRILARGKYDVVITAGWLDFACQAAYATAPILGHQYVIWCESTPQELSWQRTLTKPLIKFFVKGAAATIAVGSLSQQYLLELGANPEKLEVAYSTVDVDYFLKRHRLLGPKKTELRQRFHLPPKKTVFMYSGQLIERKGIDTLIRAYAQIMNDSTHLLIVGYGPQKETLQQLANNESIRSISFFGHQELPTLTQLYACADVFVLPSHEETWGLVINEAMASGLPVVTSDAVGCHPDLIQQGRNGFVFTKNNFKELADILQIFIQKPQLRKKMGELSLSIIKEKSPTAAAQSFRAAVETAYANKK